MIRLNEHLAKIAPSYLFSTVSRKVKEFQERNPELRIVRMGIGDVTLPLVPAVAKAFEEAVREMADPKTFRGYGPEQGYDFLREAIAENDYRKSGASVSADDIFISDGSKCDTANFQELFSRRARVAVPDPVYPVYVDTNVMAGRTGILVAGRYRGLNYLECSPANGFVPEPPRKRFDLVYLCFPNNPTGSTISKDQLALWVEYARKNKALILYDAAYESFIRDPSLPRSIYEIPGAEEVAVEFRSFSKTAGFTGTRCAFTVVPSACRVYDAIGRAVPLKPHWNRRQTTKFNGVAYPVQRAAAAVYTSEGRAQVVAQTDYYLGNAKLIRDGLEAFGYRCTGGRNSPYVWVDTKRPSWESFDRLLEEAHVVCTPGAGFGLCGEGYVRFSAFNDRAAVIEGVERLKKVLAS